MSPIRAAVFDAYGTLLDVHAAMARHIGRLPPDWERISAEWRAKQLEYTWVRTLTGPAHHRDFWTLTQEALAFVAARHVAPRAPCCWALRMQALLDFVHHAMPACLRL